MSKLPKAPLIEVVFELRWIIDPHEFQTIQYLSGDLYPSFRSKYPYRETIQGIPLFGQAPTSRFRAGANDYPLVQVGPGIFTINTNDTKYFWNEYESSVIDAFEKLNGIYHFKDSHNVTLTLRYIDFIKFDFSKNDVLRFLNEKLHIQVSQGFYTTDSVATNFVLNLNYEDQLGSLNVAISQGKNTNNVDGIVIQTSITSRVIKPEVGGVKAWLDKAHELTSDVFKKMTKGYLQEQFALN